MAEPSLAEPSLEHQILAAHSNHDGEQLALLYARAGDKLLAEGNHDAACFFFTHARVFALEEGMQIAETLHQKLIEFARDQ